MKLSKEYWTYKNFYNFPPEYKGNVYMYTRKWNSIISEYELKKENLRFIRIYFDTFVFDRVTKDRSAKFVDMLSAIGGTLGLLSGFSIISGVEIVYFAIKVILRLIDKKMK